MRDPGGGLSKSGAGWAPSKPRAGLVWVVEFLPTRDPACGIPQRKTLIGQQPALSWSSICHAGQRMGAGLSTSAWLMGTLLPSIQCCCFR